MWLIAKIRRRVCVCVRGGGGGCGGCYLLCSIKHVYYVYRVIQPKSTFGTLAFVNTGVLIHKTFDRVMSQTLDTADCHQLLSSLFLWHTVQMNTKTQISLFCLGEPSVVSVRLKARSRWPSNMQTEFDRYEGKRSWQDVGQGWRHTLCRKLCIYSESTVRWDTSVWSSVLGAINTELKFNMQA